MVDYDNELVIRLREDDVGAFNALYWKYHQAVYANIFKLTKEVEVTQDILQEVFIALWEKRSSIDINQTVSGWLFVVSYNKSISYLKRALKESVISNEWNEEMQPAEESEINVREVQLQLLEDALGQLSPQKKKVFELCKLQGKSYEETARELNISKHTVKEYLSAAIANVKEYIKEHPDYISSLFCPLLLSRFLS
ncbi:MAG: sigma-70 family RNA polymerase sigma factor [Flavisolibacter sp.]|nr:sigma-70 family RNA polymerase sigma factor [Flavisolibacter sp.]MBD0351400.1 sigma-70 family RNA polymerase sigma factor [Flavisolibacter sp.]MBD0374264.1 sigma-70 family RNA polymerase sigma factor [Flavisolibacter sp.]